MAAAPDKLPLGRLAVYVFAGGGLAWVIFLALQLLFFASVEDLRQTRVYQNRNREVQVLQRQQQETRDSYRWVDRESKRVGIPIEQAMDLTLKELRRQ